MKGRILVAVLLLVSMPITLAPVNLWADGVTPPPLITEVYTGTDPYGSMDLYTVNGGGQYEVDSFFSSADGSTITIKMDLITHKVVTTLPGGKIVALPQSHSQTNITFSTYSGQTWQVSVDASGNMLTPNGESISEEAMAAIGAASQGAVTAFRSFTVAEGLVVQDPSSGLLVANASREENIQIQHTFFSAACMLSLFDLVGATIGFVGGCGTIPVPFICPWAAAWYYDALMNYYRDCVWS
ncbi:MAG: hypothetical protein WBS54_09345 [Acidobacteriota bacterium]